MQQIQHETELGLGGLVLCIQFESLLELMLGTFVPASVAKYESPYYPIVFIVWLFLYTFSNLLDSFNNITLFELGKGPMHVRIVIRIMLLSLSAGVKGLIVDHVDVEEECKVVVGVWMLVI